MTDAFRIDVTTDELSVALKRLITAYGDLTPLMETIGDQMIESTRQNFRSGETPDGTPWAARSQTTLDAYGRAKPPKSPKGGPLVLTGTLSENIFDEANAESVSWGAGAGSIQAAVMQLGAKQGEFGAHIGKDKNGRDHFSTIPWGDIPARPYLGIGPEDETGIFEAIEDWLEGVVQD